MYEPFEDVDVAKITSGSPRGLGSMKRGRSRSWKAFQQISRNRCVSCSLHRVPQLMNNNDTTENHDYLDPRLKISRRPALLSEERLMVKPAKLTELVD